MSFEIQELPDVIKIITLISLEDRKTFTKSFLKSRIDHICDGLFCVDLSDLDEALGEMVAEGLIDESDSDIELTERGAHLSSQWRSLILKEEPILEVVAGLTDGSITGLVVILSAYIAGLTASLTTFAALLTLSSVSITNFSSFFLGGKTEDVSDILALQNLVNFSLSDIPDAAERSKSLNLVKQLFMVLGKDIGRANFRAAMLSGATTFLAGIIPILVYLLLPEPLDLILSLTIVAIVVLVFLVRYRSKIAKVHWKVTLFETAAIITIAVIASLLLSRGI